MGKFPVPVEGSNCSEKIPRYPREVLVLPGREVPAYPRGLRGLAPGCGNRCQWGWKKQRHVCINKCGPRNTAVSHLLETVVFLCSRSRSALALQVLIRGRGRRPRVVSGSWRSLAQNAIVGNGGCLLFGVCAGWSATRWGEPPRLPLPDGTANITQAEYGPEWPLAVPQALLHCENDAVWAETGGTRYPINGVAMTWLGDLRPGATIRELENTWL